MSGEVVRRGSARLGVPCKEGHSVCMGRLAGRDPGRTKNKMQGKAWTPISSRPTAGFRTHARRDSSAGALAPTAQR
jgi:hypothetical protein